ncbi:MAG TPA: UTP--glucose-1-phosphate uridylyltransferase [Thermoplasmata archaeon]|nr:UTP--glucose-1-phosphate uridylyltransferase [Thermoplasmata archaeon]
MKVVIPAAGLGTRFLPATKSQPKEMLPVIDRPIIQYVVEEAIAAGSDDLLIVTGRGKRAIEDHFDHSPELDGVGDRPEIQHIAELGRRAQLHYLRQRFPKGLGDAIGLARHHTGSEPFGVLLGDTIHVCDPPLLRQLWNQFERVRGPVIAVETVPEERVSHYGIMEGTEVAPGLFRCDRLLEKPSPRETSSRLGITGAYVLTSDIYAAIDETPPGYHGEIQITDALQILSERRPVFASTFSGTRYDIGDRCLWVTTNLEFALRDPALRPQLVPLLLEVLRQTEPEGGSLAELLRAWAPAHAAPARRPPERIEAHAGAA